MRIPGEWGAFLVLVIVLILAAQTCKAAVPDSLVVFHVDTVHVSLSAMETPEGFVDWYETHIWMASAAGDTVIRVERIEDPAPAVTVYTHALVVFAAIVGLAVALGAGH